MPRNRAVVNKKELKIEYVSLEQVKRWPRNPKNHDLDALEKSIDRFGFVQPIVIDGESNRLVAGHGRLEALLRLKERGESLPGRIKIDKKSGEWMVPVLSGIHFKSEAEAEAYLIADNRIVELGGWDVKILTEMLHEMSADGASLDGIGYDRKDVDAMWIRLHAELNENNANFNPEYQFRVEIECDDENQQRAFLERFETEGLKCRALIL